MLIPVDFGRGAVIKDDPGASDVHVDAPLGSKRPSAGKAKRVKVKNQTRGKSVFRLIQAPDDNMGGGSSG